ncbi:YheC/YheD family protein [Paenibacillus sp.]|uniref:YheC/YheD family endospore coat-associated protein n=1 Tax=Paenibacillus sp. TaxID=58172 RepID=UPI002D5D00B6|nr:YheC/YheD family protein [Paenibacillus sp.]HZG58456.1 YheC/YheD family protein [Paenibacillus sp.]
MLAPLAGSRRRRPAHLGILATPKEGPAPFGSAAFFSRLARTGRRLGLDVFVFALEWVDWIRRTTVGYVFDEAAGAWTRGVFPLPALVYDRAFHRTRAQAARHRAGVARLAALPGVALLGLGLGGKLEVYRLLAKEPALRDVLPPTEPYDGPASLARWLKSHGDAVLKPQGGTHGKGVFRIRRLDRGADGSGVPVGVPVEVPVDAPADAPGDAPAGADAEGGPTPAHRYEALGRTGANRAASRRFASLRALLAWVDGTLVRGRQYLIQPYLSLTADDGAPFDVRALVQKDGSGRWTLTGAAARVGPKGGLTSNLHGGGSAYAAEDYLLRQFGRAETDRILRRIRRAALTIPPALERGHGPLLELGVDFGVDRGGRVWVLEVNSKPGRTSFTRLKDDRAGVAAVTSPIRYARYVLDRQLGGQNT